MNRINNRKIINEKGRKKNLILIATIFIMCLGGLFLLPLFSKTDHAVNDEQIETVIENNADILKDEDYSATTTDDKRTVSEVNEFEGTESDLTYLPDGNEAEASYDETDNFWIKYIDVGQGDAALIHCNGHYMLIDGGPSDESRKIYSILAHNHIDYIDVIVVTHPDADHIGGISGALNISTVGTCYCPVTEYDTKTFNSLIKYLNYQDVAITVPDLTESFYLGNAYVDIISSPCVNCESNNNSIITKITYGNNSFLFMGDAETEEEYSIIASGIDLGCDVIKIGHHGSSNSTSQKLLNSANPEYAIISVGSDNSYGHPTEQTLARLINQNIEIYRTDYQGDIICESDGENINFITEKNIPIEKSVATNDEIKQESNTYISTYVLNTNTKKFHIPGCSSVYDMKPQNRKDVNLSRDDIINQGYVPCKRCNP